MEFEVLSLGVLQPIRAIPQNLYLADVFDVLIIALLIYTALFLFKQTRSFLVLAGVGIVIVLYILAQIFNLYLTSLVLQSFFSVFFIILAIIFQEELRRFFEYLAAFGTRQRRGTGSNTIDEIVQAVEYLAHHGIGALIVITGSESIARHAEGGRMIDSIISDDIITSLFDPSSPGHDGAMIIHRDRILEFGTHLPLSSDFKQTGKHGTRHSAALGISEESDALAIVVSEEQGTVSLAHEGKLRHMKNPEELSKHISDFLKQKSPEQAYSFFENLVKKNWLEKVFALLLAIIIWFSVAFRAETVRRDFLVPITYSNLPESFLIEEAKPREITVTLEGRGKSAFDRLDPKILKIAIDAGSIKQGKNVIELNEKMISRPFNFGVTHMDPEKIELTAQTYQFVELSIEPDIQGSPRAPFVIDELVIIPSTLSFLIPNGIIPPSAIFTEPIIIDGLRENKKLDARLLIPRSIKAKQQISEVSIEVRVRRR